MNRKNRKAVKVQSEGSLSYFCVRLSRQITSNWECSCSNLLLKPAAAKATRKGRGWALPIAMYILPSWLDTFTACQGQSIDNPQSRLTWDLINTGCEVIDWLIDQLNCWTRRQSSNWDLKLEQGTVEQCVGHSIMMPKHYLEGYDLTLSDSSSKYREILIFQSKFPITLVY